jgi:hypothetical protein
MKCENKFWLENPPDLVCSFALLPMKDMDLSEQMNSATRLVVVIFLILLLIDIKKALIFLIAGIILIIILYYIQKERMHKTEGYKNMQNQNIHGQIRENFSQEYDFFDQQFRGDPAADTCCAPLAIITYGGPPNLDAPSAKEYRRPMDIACESCTDITPTGSGPNFYSRNQALAGQANPRTLIPPVITPKSHDLEYWKANNLVIHSNINAESFVDLYQSGYEVSNCCNYTCDKNLGYTPSNIQGRAPVLSVFQANPPMTRDYNVPGCTPVYGEIIEELPMIQGELIEDVTDEVQNEMDGVQNEMDGDIIEGYKAEPFPPINYNTSYKYPYFSTNQPQTGAAELGVPPSGPRMLGPLKSGQRNMACGFNPENVEVNLPTNAVTGMCQRDDAYSDYNKNLYTQTIQPNVYMQNQVNDPINANIGISFQQQFQPTTCQSNNDGVFYTLHDPSIIEPAEYQMDDCPQMDSSGQRVNRSNVYDPRFYGYGTSYRSYTDPMLGQTKYNYDDINLIKQPNYITRSKIDSFQFADSYGPAKPQLPLGAVKALSQDKWLRDSLSFRTGLQEQWMRKMNTILGQRRQMPNSARYYSGSVNRCK